MILIYQEKSHVQEEVVRLNKILTAHRYKYSQEKPRKILKKMEKKGLVEFIGLINKEFTYKTNEEGKQEFYKRMGLT